MTWKRTLIAVLSSAVLAGGGCKTLTMPQNPVRQVSSFENNNISLEELVVKETVKSVERVEVTAIYQIKKRATEIKKIFGKSGSGTVLNEKDGYYYFLTAQHVVEMPEVISLTSSSAASPLGRDSLERVFPTATSTASLKGRIAIRVAGLDAELLCSSREPDYALLRIPSNGKLFPLSKNEKVYLGDSDHLEVGDYVYAMGYPLGLDRFVSDGIVSNTNFPAPLFGIFKILRNDAFMFTSPISPGNSGGPIFTVAEGNLYLVGVISGYYPIGNDLYLAFKINDILKDVRRKGFNLHELNTKIPGNYYNIIPKDN